MDPVSVIVVHHMAVFTDETGEVRAIFVANSHLVRTQTLTVDNHGYLTQRTNSEPATGAGNQSTVCLGNRTKCH